MKNIQKPYVFVVYFYCRLRVRFAIKVIIHSAYLHIYKLYINKFLAFQLSQNILRNLAMPRSKDPEPTWISRKSYALPGPTNNEVKFWEIIDRNRGNLFYRTRTPKNFLRQYTVKCQEWKNYLSTTMSGRSGTMFPYTTFRQEVRIL